MTPPSLNPDPGSVLLPKSTSTSPKKLWEDAVKELWEDAVKEYEISARLSDKEKEALHHSNNPTDFVDVTKRGYEKTILRPSDNTIQRTVARVLGMFDVVDRIIAMVPTSRYRQYQKSSLFLGISPCFSCVFSGKDFATGLFSNRSSSNMYIDC